MLPDEVQPLTPPVSGMSPDPLVSEPVLPSIPSAPSIIIKQPFSLELMREKESSSLDKLRDEIMDKVKSWENGMSPFFQDYSEISQSWRISPRETNGKKPRGLFNSKSGETHRATETMATVWLRMLTAATQFFEAQALGYGPDGRELTEQDLYSVEKVLMRQLEVLRFKEKLLRSLRSLAIFGTAIFEEPWVVRYGPDGQVYFEGTDLQHRSLIQTGFDTSVFDMDLSDYIFTVDYPSKWKLRDWAKNDPLTWDRSQIDKHIAEMNMDAAGAQAKHETQVFSRMDERRKRAGYLNTDKNVSELIQYHGRIDSENPVIMRYWESLGRQDDPGSSDFTLGLLESNVVKLHMTQYKTWRSRFKTAHFKLFELEALGYGVGKIGQRLQRELDNVESRANDGIQFGLYAMWKVGRYAGLKASQLNIKPNQIIEMEDINQLEQIRIDTNVIAQALAMQGIRREDFRTAVGATSNLQAVNTAATATEASLTQTEAIRGASVHAEIIGETFIREHLEQMHINNLDNLDADIWISVSGESKPRPVNRFSLPKNIGFEMKITTDKDFAPNRQKAIIEILQLSTSIRNVMPQGVNVVRPLFEQLFRSLGFNPRLLNKPVPMVDQLRESLKQAQSGPANEIAGEMAGEAAGSGANVSTPVGPVPTSPLSNNLIQGVR